MLPHSRLIYRVLVSHLWDSKRHQKGKLSFSVNFTKSQLNNNKILRIIKGLQTRIGSSTFSVVHCGGDVEFTDGEVEHGD